MSPAKVLMPLSFATLLGGMCSLTGTPANLVVNDWVVSQTGRSLAYFELGIVGFPLVLAGLLFLAVTSHRLFARFGDGDAEPWEAGSQEFIVERQVTAGSELVGVRAPEFERKFASTLHAVIRNNQHVFARHQDIMIASGDVLLIQSQLGTIYELEEDGALAPLDLDGVATDTATEFVVMPDSLLIGSRVEDVQYQARGNCQVTALASRRVRVEGRFRDLQLGMGDLLMVAGEREDLRSLASDCGLMALSPRRNTQATRQAARAIAVFSAGVLASAFEIAPTEIAFGAVVLAMAVMGQLNLRAALQDTNWTIVILLACMIPLGMAVEETGAARVIADGIAGWLPTSKPLLVVVMMLALATAITPFIDNVSTAVVLSPIAAGLATRTGTPVEPLLMAVAIGASMDFLTPFGHHNNSVVMGAGGYRFLDFPRLGLPLVVLCMAIATIVFALILRA